MKKLHFNSTLNHKASDYKPCEICVERVVTLYGRSFEELKNHLMHDDPYIVAYRDLMYTEGDTAHCLLFVDYDSGDGVLVESEGSNYARKSQFIPNARALLESNEMTAAETRLHNDLKKIADKVAELADVERNLEFLEQSTMRYRSGKMQDGLEKRESTIIFRLIKDIDPNAFVSQSAVIGVYGEGFDRIKVK